MGDYVARAEKALRTGQTNLAVLYMRRGISETAAGRSWLAWHDFAGGVVAAAAGVGVLLDDVFAVLVGPRSLTQADLALVGPA